MGRSILFLPLGQMDRGTSERQTAWEGAPCQRLLHPALLRSVDAQHTRALEVEPGM